MCTRFRCLETWRRETIKTIKRRGWIKRRRVSHGLEKNSLKRKHPGTPKIVELQIAVPNGKYLTTYFINKFF